MCKGIGEYRAITLTNSQNQTTGGADNYTGTSGNDTFLATATDSFDNGDVINGGAGTDSLTARYNLTDDKTVNGSVTNVEIIKIDLDDGDTANDETLTFSVASATGLTSVVVTDSTSTAAQEDTVNVTGIAAGVALGITNGDANVDVDFDFADTTSLTDAATLELNAAKANDVIIAGVETITVNAASGTSTLDTVTLDAATKMVLTGAGKLTISGMTAASLDEFDGSAATGNISIAGFIAGDVSVAGGAGNDTFDFTVNGLDATDTVVGGNGTDRLVVAEAQATALANVSGIEELAFKLADTSADDFEIDASVVSGLRTVVIAAEDGDDDDGSVITVSNLSDTQNVVVEDAGADTADADGIDLTLTSATDTTTNVASISLKGIGVPAAAVTTGLGTVTVDNIETVTIASDKNAANTVTTNGVEALAASGTKTLTVTGAADLTISEITNTTALTSVDASAATGKFSISGLDASALSFKAGSGQTTISMAGLNASDTIVGGSNTKDQLTATAVTGLTATTGKLNVTNVETVILQATGANTIDASLMTGVTTLAFSGATPGTQTVTGLAAGTAIGVGEETAGFDNGDIISVALADSTGTADSLTFKIDNRGGADTDVDLKASGIENVTLTVLDDDTGNDATVDMTQVKATSITVTGGFASAVLNLDTLAAETTTVNTSAYKGDVVFSGADATAAMTVTTAASTADSAITLSAKNDTITVAETGAVDVDIDGGAGNDTLNLSVKAGFIDSGEIDNVEFINLAIRAGDDITLGAGADEVNGIDEATKLVVTGGNELSTLTIGGAGDTLADTTPTLLTIDASAFAGNIALVYAADALTQDIDIKAGALTTDTVTASYDANNTDVALKLNGVETLKATLDSGSSGSETYSIDLANTVGLGVVALQSPVAITDLNIDSYVSTTTVQLGTAVGSHLKSSTNLDVNLASATGTADTVNLKLVDTEDTGTIDVDAVGAEVLNIEVSTDAESHSLNLAGVTATTGSTVTINVTGGVSTDGLTIADVDASARVINASTFAGTLTVSDRGSSAMTITGGTAGDSIRMENAADVLDGGADTGDTLVIAQNAVLGGFQVDLSSTTDQVTTYNGSANSAVQKGFLNLDASGITGTFGIDVTANSAGSTITGTSNNDQITLGDGADTVYLASTGKDTVLSFTQAEDFLNVENLNDIDSEEAVAANAAVASTADKEIYVFADGADGSNAQAIADYTDLTDVAAFLADAITEDDAHTYAAVINDLAGGKAYVYYINVDAVTGSADTIESGDITLVGVVTTDAAITTANINFTA